MKSESQLPSLLPLEREELDTIPGWFGDADPYVLSICTAVQHQFNVFGDILEIGTYMGQSAVLLGRLLDSTERLVVCDLFEVQPRDERNATEVRTYYSALTRAAFEDNYARLNGSLPEILQTHSSEIGPLLRDRKFRIIHIDGSHEWDAVTEDLALARELLDQDGLVVLDDFRSAHAMGVGAAAWTEILAGTLFPLVVTTAKLYASFARPTYLEHLFTDLSGVPELRAQRFSPPWGDILFLPPLPRTPRHPLLREILPPILRTALLGLRDWRKSSELNSSDLESTSALRRH